jgi:hypothetical protein
MNKFYTVGLNQTPKNNIEEMKKLVKAATKYDLNQISIDAYTESFIDYSIYKNQVNDKRLGIPAIVSGRLEV